MKLSELKKQWKHSNAGQNVKEEDEAKGEK
jgi:hypothetical protein